MFVGAPPTASEDVRLVAPDVARGAPRSLEWLAGEAGRETLRLMGVTPAENHAFTLERERERIHGFLEKPDELDWMIEHDGNVVGVIWVDMKPNERLPAPAISLMVGDPGACGHGVGLGALQAVVGWLGQERRVPVVYARHLVDNVTSASLLQKTGFMVMGEPYYDHDGLYWQNAQRTILEP